MITCIKYTFNRFNPPHARVKNYFRATNTFLWSTAFMQIQQLLVLLVCIKGPLDWFDIPNISAWKMYSNLCTCECLTTGTILNKMCSQENVSSEHYWAKKKSVTDASKGMYRQGSRASVLMIKLRASISFIILKPEVKKNAFAGGVKTFIPFNALQIAFAWFPYQSTLEHWTFFNIRKIKKEVVSGHHIFFRASPHCICSGVGFSP